MSNFNGFTLINKSTGQPIDIEYEIVLTEDGEVWYLKYGEMWEKISQDEYEVQFK